MTHWLYRCIVITERGLMIIIKIKTDNAAFYEDDPDHDIPRRVRSGIEVGRILHKLADEYSSVGHAQFEKLYDINGNAVGTVRDSG